MKYKKINIKEVHIMTLVKLNVCPHIYKFVFRIRVHISIMLLTSPMITPSQSAIFQENSRHP